MESKKMQRQQITNSIVSLIVLCLLVIAGGTAAAEKVSAQMKPHVVLKPGDAEILRQLNEDSEKTLGVKDFDPAWVRSLGDRGEPTVYTRDNSATFDLIGMPVGGVGAGQLYLGGDGKLWYWDIFNLKYGGDVRRTETHHNPYHSTYPATIFEFTVSNTSEKEVSGELFGWLENAVCLESRKESTGQLENSVVSKPGVTLVSLEASGVASPETVRDFGSMALAVVGPKDGLRANASFERTDGPLEGKISATSTFKDKTPVGAIGRTFKLAAGEKKKIQFVVAWYFPNLDRIPIRTAKGRSYGTRFDWAADVAEHIAGNYEYLAG